jgi:hypothetical protein
VFPTRLLPARGQKHQTGSARLAFRGWRRVAIVAMALAGAFVSTLVASLSAADLGSTVGLTALVSLSFALAAVAMTTLAWMLHAWRSPQHLEATGFARPSGMPTLPSRCWSLLGMRRRSWATPLTRWLS